jgi:hypothetical protein
MGNAAAVLPDEKRGISSVRLRGDAHDQLQVYAEALEPERASPQIKVDSGLVWTGAASQPARAQDSPRSPGARFLASTS